MSHLSSTSALDAPLLDLSPGGAGGSSSSAAVTATTTTTTATTASTSATTDSSASSADGGGHRRATVKSVEFDQDQYFGTGNQDAIAKDSEGDEREDVIEMRNVHKTYLLGIEGVPALRGVSMTVKRGEFVCIFGTSGGGKTTLLNIMGTIDKPTKGELYICGQRINSNTPDKDLARLRLRKLAFVFQTFNLLSSLSALENVELPMVLDGSLSRRQRRRRAKELLGRVGMTPRLKHVPSQLSGGEQQRVTIARAMANKPEILLLDEPTGDLDTINTLIVLRMLTDLNKRDGITLVMVTHDVGLKFFADRIIWMRDGRIQRVEVVDEQRKRESYQKLDDDLKRLGLDAASRDAAAASENDDADAASDDDDAVAAASAAGTGAEPATLPPTAASATTTDEIEMRHTEIRKPRDYATWSPRSDNSAATLRNDIDAALVATTAGPADGAMARATGAISAFVRSHMPGSSRAHAANATAASAHTSASPSELL